MNKLGLEYEFLGEQEVKNIERPVRVYRLLSSPGASAHRVIRAKSALQRKWWRAVLIIAAIVIVVAGAFAIWNFFLRHPPIELASVEKMAFPLPEKPSMAVLPFANLSDVPEQEYFADGMTDDLITDLSKISGLFVIVRNSTFAHKGKPMKIRQVAEELGVRYVLEGSVRRADDRVRINTQLIDATTGGHLWAERYDGRIGDVFALQDKITQRIVASLALKLTAGEQEYVVRKETKNIGLPGAADIHKEIISEWANKNNVEINIDFVAESRDIRSIASAEYKAHVGHDVMMLPTFNGASFKNSLEPLNDVATYIQKKYGKFDELATYLSYQDGIWVTVPTPLMSRSYPMVSRIDLFREHAGINLLDIFPTDFTKRDNTKVNAWAVCKRTRPDIAAQLWLHDIPKGPKDAIAAPSSRT